MERLVLWDIDHTLIATRGVGGLISAEAFERLTGRAPEAMAEVTGKSERVILAETLALHGMPRDAVSFDAYAEALAEGYLRHAAELRERGHALPGAAAALDALAQVPGVVQTAATGNVRRVAETKLQLFGLDRHIDWNVGGYGEDAEDRPDLVRCALRRAGVPAERAALFGDTVADVEAARVNGVFAVGVATGRTSAGELMAAGADCVLSGLADTAAVVDLVLRLASAGRCS